MWIFDSSLKDYPNMAPYVWVHTYPNFVVLPFREATACNETGLDLESAEAVWTRDLDMTIQYDTIYSVSIGWSMRRRPENQQVE